MAERTPTKKPQVITGTTLESGTPNTGQIPYTMGGSKLYNNFSGLAGGDANIHAGGGRVDRVIVHGQTSGVIRKLYDSAVAVSGGPLATSGHKIVGIIPANTWAGGPGGGVFGAGPHVIDLGVVFTSGLCITGASGQVGVSVSYTPVVSG